MKILKVKRVSYGKFKTPMEDREYRLDGHTAVGCINEILKAIAKPNGYDKMYLEDIDGTYEVDVKTGKTEKKTERLGGN